MPLRLAVLVPSKLSLLLAAALIATLTWVPALQLPDGVTTSAAARFVAESTRAPSVRMSAPVQVEQAQSHSAGPSGPRQSVEDLSARDRAPFPRLASGDEPDARTRPARHPVPALTAAPEASPSPTPTPTAATAPKARSKPPKAAPKATPTPTPAPSPRQTPKPPKNEPEPAPEPPASSYSGTSRLWYPALGIKAAWKWYGCAHGGSPDGLGAGIYRWGCVPKNNVYLMSHAWSTFEAVRRGYHSGAMRTGQSVWYANSQGDVSQWKVKWVKRVTLEHFRATMWEWAANDSPGPIMTFQTCDGRNDQFRIIVRLVPNN